MLIATIYAYREITCAIVPNPTETTDWQRYEETMTDNLALIAAAVAFSAVAWAFWHFTGGDGFNVLSLVALVVVAADNLRLRRLLRKTRAS